MIASLQRAELYRYRLPLTRPLSLGSDTIREREGLLVKLVSDEGQEGWGEIAPLPNFSTESLTEATSSAISLVADIQNEQRTIAQLELLDPDSPVWNAVPDTAPPSVRFGLDQALLHLAATLRNRPVIQLLSTDYPNQISVNALLTNRSSSEAGTNGSSPDTTTRIKNLTSTGYRSLKIKVARQSLARDIAWIAEIQDILPADVTLRLDANQGWTRQQAREFTRNVDASQIEYLEEPLDEPEQLASFARETGWPIALDEAVQKSRPDDLKDHSYATALILKPTLIGGIRETLRWNQQADRHGISPVISSSFESGVGLLGLGTLAAALQSPTRAAGLDTRRHLARDLIGRPLRIQHGTLWGFDAHPDEIQPNLDRLEKMT